MAAAPGCCSRRALGCLPPLWLLPALCHLGAGLANHAKVRCGQDVLFVLHDAGESFALNGTVRRLLAERVGVCVLPLGQPATDVALCAGRYAGCTPLPTVTLAELGVHVPILDGTSGRGQLLREDDVAKVQRALAPRVAVTGMNYAMQLQLGFSVRESAGARFATFYDSLRVLGSDSDIPASLQRRFVRTADEVWLASEILKPSLGDWGGRYRVVGQPTLQDWQALRGRVAELRDARQNLYGHGAVASGAPALCWFGGYGPGYEKALRAWCRAAKAMSAGSDLPGLRFSLASHPGRGHGALDLRVLHEERMERLVTVVPEGMPGKVAALASNLTVSQGSTGGVQSTFAGTPALFLDPALAFNNAGNLGVLLGLIPNTHSGGAAAGMVRQVARAGWSVDLSKAAAAGIPRDATGAMVNATLSLLRLLPAKARV